MILRVNESEKWVYEGPEGDFALFVGGQGGLGGVGGEEILVKKSIRVGLFDQKEGCEMYFQVVRRDGLGGGEI